MTSSHRRWYGAAAIALVVPAGWALVRLIAELQATDHPFAMYGARLGLTAAQLRDDFQLAGEWALATDEVGALTLTWAPSSVEEADAPSSAIFEFHEGLLVAMRFRVPSGASIASGDPLVVVPDAVLHREPLLGGEVEVTVIARNCPTHAEEVSRLLTER